MLPAGRPALPLSCAAQPARPQRRPQPPAISRARAAACLHWSQLAPHVTAAAAVQYSTASL